MIKEDYQRIEIVARGVGRGVYQEAKSCFTLYITSTLHNIACGFFAKNFWKRSKYDQTIRHLSVRAVNDKKKKKGVARKGILYQIGIKLGILQKKKNSKWKKKKKPRKTDLRTCG